MVAEDSGLCIQGATVQVVAGQALGRSETQTEPCDVWDAGGVTFNELVPGVELTLRASASGYVAQERVVVPRIGPTDGCDLYAVSESVSELTNPDPSLAVYCRVASGQSTGTQEKRAISRLQNVPPDRPVSVGVWVETSASPQDSSQRPPFIAARGGGTAPIIRFSRRWLGCLIYGTPVGLGRSTGTPRFQTRTLPTARDVLNEIYE